jgi:hypothetical protein
MPNCDSRGNSEGPHRNISGADENLASEEDLMMEQILKNITTTPIGQVLQKIASLPEVRQEKILAVRRQLTEGKYNLNERLDIVLDKVLEDLAT